MSAAAAEQVPPLLEGRIADLLDGAKIAMTGVTGFIGEQILWRVLTDLPGTTATVLVRRKGSAGAHDRVATLLRKPVFRELVEAHGGVDALMAARVEVLEGDLPHVPVLPRDIDVLVHCAGDVSFDPQIDEAFATNVVGTRALLERFLESVTGPDGRLERIPHYVHISTAYTAGRRRGAIPEAAHEHDVDVETETRAAMAMRDLVESQSRTVERLTALRRAAEREHRAAGFLTTAADTERRRREWVHERLVEAGIERARSLGWTDCYTFAKTMGETVVAELGKDIRVSIVRPAIVESSLVHPYPGWLEGFKMADPIILAYGKGDLPEFPASPDAVIDIVPCDHVVNAIVAVCATRPEPGRVEYYHCASGARNPLTFRAIYEHIRAYFSEHPLEDGAGAVELPVWRFPGAAPVERFLGLGERAHAAADRAVRWLPRSAATRRAAAAVAKQGKSLEFLRRYLSLYSEYLQSELHFVDDRTLALHRSLHPDDVERFAFDTGAIDWHHYLHDVHVPAVVRPVARLKALKRAQRARASTYRPLTPAGERRLLAAFDLDGTVMTTNVVETYLWARLPELGTAGRAGEVAGVLGRLPRYLAAERADRGTFLRALYRRYAGADLAELERYVDEDLSAWILDRLSPEAVRRIREHRAAGHRTVLLTGVVRPLTRPLAPLFDEVVAADLATDADGRCTGFLTGPPMVGESRAAWLRHHAAQHAIDLAASYAYADSHVDLPMLRAVGSPVAVNPDVGLQREARARAWSVVDWAPGSPVRRWSVPNPRRKQ